MKLIFCSLPILLVGMPIDAAPQLAAVFDSYEFFSRMDVPCAPQPQAAGSQTGRHSLLYTTVGAVAGAGLGLAMATSITGELCVAGEVGCDALFLSLYGGFVSLGASIAAQAANSEPAWMQTALGALVGGAISLVLSELYWDRFSEPTPGEWFVIGTSLLVPPIVGAVIGNRLGQGGRSASGG